MAFMRRRRWTRWALPRSLVGRVSAVYVISLTLFVVAGVALFIRYQFTEGLASAEQRVEGLALVVSPTIAESAVIGDYDSLKRTLDGIVRYGDLSQAEFIDMQGSRLRAKSQEAPISGPPRWLAHQIESRLFEVNQPIGVGGRDYGVLRLSFAPERIAGVLWRQILLAVALGGSALAGGLFGILIPLRRWLLDRQRAQDTSTSGGPVLDDVPVEFQRAFAVIARTTQERESALVALREVLGGLSEGARATQGDDIRAITMLIGELTTKLQERSEQLDAIFQLSPDGFVSFDARHCVNYVSPAFTQLTGLEEADVLGLDEHGLVSRWQDIGGIRAEQLSALSLMRSAGQRVTISVERPKRRVLEFALHVGEMEAVSQVLLVQDVTHRTEVDQMKSEFLSMAAHELRTPMTSIFGFVELLVTQALGAQQQKLALETIHRQSRLMISIIDELLDLARIEARRGMDFEFHKVELGALVQQVVSDFKPPDARAPAQVTLPGSALTVSVDRKKFAQALGNVLSNAYKYSPDGGPVEVHVESHGDSATVCVSDRGMGMSAEQLSRVCERFWRADASGSIPGTGLGMAIVKEIVELLGGALDVESESGVGTQVTIELPLMPAQSRWDTDTLALQ